MRNMVELIALMQSLDDKTGFKHQLLVGPYGAGKVNIVVYAFEEEDPYEWALFDCGVYDKEGEHISVDGNIADFDDLIGQLVVRLSAA